MRHIKPREIKLYRTPNGRVPFSDWYDKIRDFNLQSRIDRRLEQMADGNFGDYRSVGAGVFKLRFHFGPGYRIYFGEVDNTVVLLLCAGDKSSQETLIGQKTIGQNTRRHNNGKISNMA